MTQQHDVRHMLDRAERAVTAGDHASAAELLSDAARIQEEELGPFHPDLANTLNNLAIVAEMAGRPDDAETFYRRATAIAVASLPADHPMVTESRQNLEGFCRAHGLSIDASAVVTPPRDTDREAAKAAQIAAEPLPPVPIPGRASHSFEWVATGAVVLVVAMLLLWRPWSSREASAPTPEPGPGQQTQRNPPPKDPPPTKPPTKQGQAGGIGYHRGHRAAMPHLLEQRQQLALRSSGPIRDAGTDHFLHACQVPARCRSGASLVSRRHAAAIRDAEDSGKRD